MQHPPHLLLLNPQKLRAYLPEAPLQHQLLLGLLLAHLPAVQPGHLVGQGRLQVHGLVQPVPHAVEDDCQGARQNPPVLGGACSKDSSKAEDSQAEDRKQLPQQAPNTWCIPYPEWCKSSLNW